MSTNEQPSVSIIMPCYNRAALLCEAIDCVLKQTWTDFELICVDNGSTDNVPKILDDYARQDARIKVIHKPLTNPGDARNVGYEQSVGKYIFFLDADDIYVPHFITKMVTTMQQEKSDVVVCDVVNFVHGHPFPTITTVANRLPVWTRGRQDFIMYEAPFSFACYLCRRLFRRELIERYHLRFQSIYCGEDQFFTFYYTLQCQRLTDISDVLVYHRINERGSATNVNNRNIDLFGYCLAMQHVRTHLAPEDWPLLRTSFYDYYLGEISYALTRSNYHQGKQIFKYVHKHFPELKTHPVTTPIKRRRLLQKWYQFCNKINCFVLFYLVKQCGLWGRRLFLRRHQ